MSENTAFNDDVARELTGRDAEGAEAEFGSAGNGADPFAWEVQNARPFPDALEPAEHPEDIAADQIELHGKPQTERAPQRGEGADPVNAQPPEEPPELNLSELP